MRLCPWKYLDGIVPKALILLRVCTAVHTHRCVPPLFSRKRIVKKNTLARVCAIDCCDIRQSLQQYNTGSIPLVVTVYWVFEHSASILEIYIRLPRGERKAGDCPDSAHKEGVDADLALGTGMSVYQTPGIIFSGIIIHECYRTYRRFTPCT